MNTFKRKSLYAALAGISALGVTGAAQAVNVNPDGLGQALIYPYYTVNGGGTGGTVAPYNSLLSVVNTTNSGKVVKVRFIEARASREVLDFNLYLSPFDVWTTAIIPSGQGAGIFTTDLSCTTPPVSTSQTAPTNFVNLAYSGDPETGLINRVKEGYVEIIEMGNVTGGTLANITHAQPSPPGTPPGCGKLPNAINAPAPTDLVTGNGGLFGGISLVNVLAGGDVTENAVALAGFSQVPLWAPPSSIQPDLSQVNPSTSVVFNNAVNTTTEVDVTDWTPNNLTSPVDPVSAVLMVSDIYNEFVLDPGTKSGTDWVVTFPTKHFYYSSNNVTKLFQRNFRLGGACDDIGLVVFNREEQSVLGSFSPPPGPFTNALCWEANVITFNNTNVLFSPLALNIPTSFPNGWMDLNIPFIQPPTTPAGANHLLTVSGGNGSSRIRISPFGVVTTTAFLQATYTGLPVVGFAAQYFNNGTLTTQGGQGVQAFYTGTFAHRYLRAVNFN